MQYACFSDLLEQSGALCTYLLFFCSSVFFTIDNKGHRYTHVYVISTGLDLTNDANPAEQVQADNSKRAMSAKLIRHLLFSPDCGGNLHSTCPHSWLLHAFFAALHLRLKLNPTTSPASSCSLCFLCRLLPWMSQQTIIRELISDSLMPNLLQWC